MDLNKIKSALELFKASLETKSIPKVDDEKLYEKRQAKMKERNGTNTKGEYNYEGEKKIDKQIEGLNKRAPKGVDPKKHENCVMDVKTKGHDVGSAHAICTSSMKKEEVEKGTWVGNPSDMDTGSGESSAFPTDPIMQSEHSDEKEDKKLINEIVDDKIDDHEDDMHGKKKKKMKKDEDPEMADPENPQGLKNKRKPVTHDECGRPFAKDEDALDAKIKAKLKTEMDRRKFGEADATRHVIDRDRGETQAIKPKKEPLLNSVDEKSSLVKALEDAGHRTSALLLKNWDEMDGVAEEFVKSNYGPKGMGQYTPVDNIKRKASRTGEEIEGVGRNKAVRRYTTMGASMQRAHDAAQQKEQQKKQKDSVKTLADMSDEERAALEAKYGAKIKKQ